MYNHLVTCQAVQGIQRVWHTQALSPCCLVQTPCQSQASGPRRTEGHTYAGEGLEHLLVVKRFPKNYLIRRQRISQGTPVGLSLFIRLLAPQLGLFTEKPRL